MKGRLFYINRISDQLAVLATSVRLANRSNRSDINVMAEQLLCGLLNRIYGWHLRNVNYDMQKYPGVDLYDPDISIAVQVTAVNRLEKVRHTLEEFSNHHLDESFDRLIILILTTDSPTNGMQRQRFDPWFSGERDIWNFPYLLNSIQDLDISQLKEIFNYLTAELGTTVTAAPAAMPTHVLPALPELAVSFVPNSRAREIEEIETIYHYPNNDRPLFLWGQAGIGKTQLAIQLARYLEPLKGAYYLRYVPSEHGQAFLQKTILCADFTDYQFNDREIEYSERMNILRNEYSGSLLIIDDLLCTDRNIDELEHEHSIQELVSMGIQVIFITRQPVKANGYEVKALDPVYQLLMMRETLRDECTDEQLLGLSHAVNGNTAILYLIATILRKSRGRITPEQLLSSLRNDSSMRSDDNMSSDSSDNIITAAMRSLIGLSASDNEDHTLLQFAALLPEGGLDAIMFRNCLSRRYKPRLKQLIDQNFLIHKKGVLTVPTFIRDSILIPNGFHSAHFDAFLDALWYALDLNQYDSITAEQLAKIYSKAADTLADITGEYAFRAARLWEFVGDLSQAIQWMKRTLDLRKSRLPVNDPGLASILIDTGELYLLLNEVEDALKFFSEAVNILEQIRSTDDPDLATCYSVVGDCYYRLESHPIALDFQEKAIASFEKNVPADHPNRIIAHNRLRQLKK